MAAPQSEPGTKPHVFESPKQTIVFNAARSS